MMALVPSDDWVPPTPHHPSDTTNNTMHALCDTAGHKMTSVVSITSSEDDASELLTALAMLMCNIDIGIYVFMYFLNRLLIITNFINIQN